MNHVDHKDLFDVDLPRLEAEFGNPDEFDELLACFDKAIKEVMKDPDNDGGALKREPLSTYRKKKFHSKLRPPQGVKADMRLVYRYDEAKDTLYIFGVGKRRPLDVMDIYEILNVRPQI